MLVVVRLDSERREGVCTARVVPLHRAVRLLRVFKFVSRHVYC
jgi:hypothetical protein